MRCDSWAMLGDTSTRVLSCTSASTQLMTTVQDLERHEQELMAVTDVTASSRVGVVKIIVVVE